jgi:hypothetical protein
MNRGYYQIWDHSFLYRPNAILMGRLILPRIPGQWRYADTKYRSRNHHKRGPAYRMWLRSYQLNSHRREVGVAVYQALYPRLRRQHALVFRNLTNR